MIGSVTLVLSLVLLIAYFVIPWYTDEIDKETKEYTPNYTVWYWACLCYSIGVLIIDIKLIVTGHNDLFVELKRTNSAADGYPFTQDFTNLAVMKLYLDQCCMFIVLLKVCADT